MTMMGGALGWGCMDDGWRKGPWTPEEDRLLMEYVRLHGEGRWNSVARVAGLKRNGKSCRLRWVNYLRPDLKRGQITPQEEKIIVELHAKWGNSLPGRTDNEIKNYWRTHFKKNGKSNESTQKVKKRALKRQEQKKQFQQQQQQQQQKLQQHQQFDLKEFIAQLEGDDYRFHPPQASTAAAAFYPTANNEQCPSTVYHGESYPPEAALSEDSLWDGLWNLDDFSTGFNFNSMCTNSTTTKAMDEENQVLPAFYTTGYFN
ncbi:hypothetical protein ACLOJK_007690 [Asimina triloba]